MFFCLLVPGILMTIAEKHAELKDWFVDAEQRLVDAQISPLRELYFIRKMDICQCKSIKHASYED